MSDHETKLANAIYDVKQEYLRATTVKGPFNSAHEAYAVVLEEFDELWEEIKPKHKDRDYLNMYNEARQVAAMAIRLMVDICADKI